MPDVTCPLCAASGPPQLQIRDLVVCGSCGASLVVTETGTRRATASDLANYASDELRLAQRARGSLVRRR